MMKAKPSEYTHSEFEALLEDARVRETPLPSTFLGGDGKIVSESYSGCMFITAAWPSPRTSAVYCENQNRMSTGFTDIQTHIMRAIPDDRTWTSTEEMVGRTIDSEITSNLVVNGTIVQSLIDTPQARDEISEVFAHRFARRVQRLFSTPPTKLKSTAVRVIDLTTQAQIVYGMYKLIELPDYRETNNADCDLGPVLARYGKGSLGQCHVGDLTCI